MLALLNLVHNVYVCVVSQKMSRLATELARPSSADYSRVQILRKIKRDKNQLSVQSYLKKPKKKVINTQDSLQSSTVIARPGCYPN